MMMLRKVKVIKLLLAEIFDADDNNKISFLCEMVHNI